MLAAVSFTQTQNSAEPAYAKELDGLAKKAIDDHKTPSLALAITRKGALEFAKAYGTANLQNQVAATPNTVYRIASLTKMFTAVQILQLSEEGKLKLDDPLGKYLPSVPESWKKVTLTQLLNHTSGIKSYTDDPKVMTEKIFQPATPPQIIGTVSKAPLDFPSGTSWHYNNSGYVLLGMIIEKIDGRKYADSLKARILQPLGMTNTYFASDRRIITNRAAGYSRGQDKQFINAPYLSMDWPYAAGSIESTVLDFSKWLGALQGKKLISAASYAKMFSPTKLANGKVESYGFGWVIVNDGKRTYYSHSGGIHGFSTYASLDPETDLAIVAFANSDDFDTTQWARRAFSKVKGQGKPDAEPKSVALTPLDLENRSLMMEALSGKIKDRSKFTEQFSKGLTDELLTKTKASMGEMGDLEDFRLLEAKKLEDGELRTYRARFSEGEFNFLVARDAKGLVKGMRMVVR